MTGARAVAADDLGRELAEIGRRAAMPTKPRTRVMITFDGLLEPSDLCQFVRHRAPSRDLGIDIVHVDRGCADISVVGHAGLIDAFEMATELDPTDCVIDRVRSRRCKPTAVSAT